MVIKITPSKRIGLVIRESQAERAQRPLGRVERKGQILLVLVSNNEADSSSNIFISRLY